VLQRKKAVTFTVTWKNKIQQTLIKQSLKACIRLSPPRFKTRKSQGLAGFLLPNEFS
jgi:hypothetical protein